MGKKNKKSSVIAMIDKAIADGESLETFIKRYSMTSDEQPSTFTDAVKQRKQLETEAKDYAMELQKAYSKISYIKGADRMFDAIFDEVFHAGWIAGLRHMIREHDLYHKYRGRKM